MRDEQDTALALAMRASALGRSLIGTCGRFLPYAARVDAEGQVICVSDGIVEDERRRIEDLWTTLGRHGRRHGDAGGAVVYDAVVHDESGRIAEAVVVELRRRSQPALRAFLPYERRDGGVVFGKPRLEARDP